MATVTRRKHKNTMQHLSLIRLASLNAEVGRIIAVIEPLLADHGLIEGLPLRRGACIQSESTALAQAEPLHSRSAESHPPSGPPCVQTASR
jgi:hypothetical protein